LFTDDDLYERGAATLRASWEAYAQASSGAAVHTHSGLAVAVFPTEPERSVYNNSLLGRDLVEAARTAAIDAMEEAYAAAGVDSFAAWAYETDLAMCSDLERRGYVLATSTLAMAMALDDLHGPKPDLDLVDVQWTDYLRTFNLPDGLLATADHAAFHMVVARHDGENAVTALAFDHDGDSGIFNVATLERHRRCGLGSAITALLAHEARARGCRTASVQSTAMAEGVYTAAGFRHLGHYLEYVPTR
jgi:ribosomal protein S18 acetylase RimI-like enzyme